MKSLLRSPSLLALCLVPCCVAGVRAAPPSEELVRLVPDDVGFCLVISDLRAQHEKLVRSPWIQAVRDSPFGKALRDAPEMLQLRKLDGQLRKSLNLTWAQLRDEVLGDALVFAYRPGPAGKPEQEQGLFMLWARNQALLTRIVGRLDSEQLQKGELKALEPRGYKGLTYYRRVEKSGSTFYFLSGPLVAFTADEALLRQVLDRHVDGKTARPLGLLERLKAPGAEKVPATLWINPRAFDAELQRQTEDLKPADAQALKAFLEYWKALDGAALALTLEEQPEVVLHLHARVEALPPASRRLVEEVSKSSDLWARFPEDAVFTAAARLNLPALSDALGEFLTPEARKAISETLGLGLGLPLGAVLPREALPRLGPDCGLCVLPPAHKAGPPQLLFALRVPSGGHGARADRVLMTTLQALSVVAVLTHNRTHKDKMQIQRVTHDGVRITYFTGARKFPPGVRPAFALKGGYLVLASSPEAVRRFAANAGPQPAVDGVPMVRLSVPELSRMLKDRPDLTAALVGVPGEIPADHLKEVLHGLEFFDGVDLKQYREGTHVNWVIRLRTAVPKGAKQKPKRGGGRGARGRQEGVYHGRERDRHLACSGRQPGLFMGASPLSTTSRRATAPAGGGRYVSGLRCE